MSRTRRYQAVIRSHAIIVLGVAMLVGAVALLLASRLGLRTAIAELLPSDDPGVVALQQTQKRIGDMSLLLVGIHSPDPAANERYAHDLTEKIRALPPHVAALATYHVRDVRDFFEKNRWLYVSEADLETIRDRLRTEIGRRKNPLFVDLGGDDEESLGDMEQRLSGKAGLDQRFPNGLFATADRKYMWIAALPPGGLFVERAGEALHEAVGRLVAEVPPTKYHPAMRVELGGPVATALASRHAVERDILWVTTTCLIVVALSIWIYFRRPRSVPLIGIPAVLGTMVAFAVAELAFGYLNSSTAFLGSIIVGNGINYAIMLMSRYEEERARGHGPPAALEQAIATTWRATGVAALSASAAYASLMVTSFRGFYQFGVMGAVGCLASWAATYSTLPAMLALLDRARPGTHVGRPPLRLDPLGRFLKWRPGTLLVVLGVLSGVAVLGLTHFVRDPFEYDFRRLNAKLAVSEESRQFSANVDSLFGRWPSPTIILADKIEDVEEIRRAIRAQDTEHARHSARGKPVIGQIATIWDLLPGPPDAQARKLEILAEVRKLTKDPALAVLTDDEQKKLARIDPPADLRVLSPKDLPPLARRPFTEVDGTVGKVVLVYPVEKGLSVWNGRDLLDIASVLQRLHLSDGRVLETSGPAVVFGSMIRSILHDGPIATLASLLAVLVIVAFTLRPSAAALMALATLLLGVIWMVGSAGWAGVRVTFLNFIALPITFGIGIEYAVNVVSRYRQDRDISKAVVSTGGAVALCSWTTIVGYGSLLAARNQALQGFGAMAILGEVACLATAIIVLPAALLWRARASARAGASGPSPETVAAPEPPAPRQDRTSLP